MTTTKDEYVINLAPPDIEVNDGKAFHITNKQLDDAVSLKSFIPELMPFNAYIVYSLWVQYSQEVYCANYLDLDVDTIKRFGKYLGVF